MIWFTSVSVKLYISLTTRGSDCKHEINSLGLREHRDSEWIITRQERWPSLAVVTISVYLKGLPVIGVNYKTTVRD